MERFSDGIRLSKKEYNSLLEDYALVAVESGNIRAIVKAAKLELEMVCDGVYNMDKPKSLCYESDYANLSKASRLLCKANDLRKEYK